MQASAKFQVQINLHAPENPINFTNSIQKMWKEYENIMYCMSCMNHSVLTALFYNILLYNILLGSPGSGLAFPGVVKSPAWYNVSVFRS